MPIVPQKTDKNNNRFFKSCWNFVVANIRNDFETAISLPHHSCAGEIKC
jgi:hypothetical protein